MLTARQREAMADAVKTNAFGSPFLNAAARIVHLHPSALRQELQNDPLFEVFVKPAPGRNFECVRYRLSEEALLGQLPIARQQLQKAGYPQAELHALLQRLHQEKKLHETDGQLHIGEGAAPDLRVHNPVRIKTATEPVSLGNADHQPLTKDETLVLNGLENIEAPRINFGLYETFVTAEEIAAEMAVKEQLGDAAVPGLLKKLIDKRQVIEPLPGRYRSRISEIVRLLKNVKQRFSTGDEDKAPFLIQSLQVRFQDRRRLLREQSFTGALNTLRDHQRSRTVNAAAKLLTSGFSRSLGRAPDDVTLTNVQERALQALGRAYLSRAGGAFVVTGNTGSGKTEAALLPLLLGALEEQVREGHKGVKALLVYPRQNLAKNQLERVCEYVAHINRAMMEPGAQGLGVQPLSVGIVFGNTPETQAHLKGEQADKYKRTWRTTGDRAFEVPYFSDAAGAAVRARPRSNGQWTMTSGGGFSEGGWELHTFQPTRQDILQSPPDILVITTEMLHRWLMDDRARNIFGLSRDYREAAPFHPPRALVMDEIHLYAGVHGAQIAALLRRFKRRVDNAMYAYGQHATEANPWRSPILIGMSATIGRPQHFWHELTGVDEHRIQALTPQDEDYGEAQGRDYYLFIRPESFSRGKRIGDASAAIQTIMTISHNMVRRAASEGVPAKFRSLIFQDSISKLKKLTVEFRDAESLKGLSSLRAGVPQGNSVFTSLAFMDGEYWYFDAADPFQYSEGRREPGQPVTTLSSGETPVYSGEGQSADILNRDVIFATTSLEVGYDDPSIQFVLQHHAPSNVASFVQKKGRAGRDLNDRPITAVTLSRQNYRDAFYYQNTRYLTDPAEYEPALNAENDFVQRFHAVALLFDELVARTGRSWQRAPEGVTLEAHLNAVKSELHRLDSRGQFITQSYTWVVAASLRAQADYATWEALWSWFTQTLLDPEVASRAGATPDLMRLCPAFPENLFSSVNLPLVQVMHPGRRNGDTSWQFLKEDVALTFSELAPGRVTRRYGRHDLYWRPPLLRVNGGPTQQNVIAMERYKPRPGRSNGPFRPDLITDLGHAQQLGGEYERFAPKRVRALYGGHIPSRFYRLRYLELWSFGRLKVNQVRDPVDGAQAYGKRNADGSVRLKLLREAPTTEQHRELIQGDWRIVSPESNSYPLGFSAARAEGVPNYEVTLPPIFGRLIPHLQYFWGGQPEGQPSRLNIWEIQYGAECTIVLHKINPQDSKAERGINTVTYASEHDGLPLLYGYDMRTEGLRVPYDRQVLDQLTDALTQQLLADEASGAHLQDQFLRYLLKSEPWTADVEGGLTAFTQRLMADVICTMRAESRARGQSGRDFLRALRNPDGWAELLSGAKTYWADHRMLNDDFTGQAARTLADDVAFSRLQALFARVQKSQHVREYVSDTLVHSLKHAARNMFTMHGSADSHLVGSSAQLSVTHGHNAVEAAFYVYERNQDGAGATRSASRFFAAKPGVSLTGRLVEEWWRYTLECPVAEDEQLLKAVIGPDAQGRAEVIDEVKRILSSPPHERQQGLVQLQHVVQRATQFTLELGSPQMGRLASQLLAEVHVLGEAFSQLDLLLELLELERSLCERFKRLPLPVEVAGFALQQVKTSGSVHELSRLYAVYERQFAQHVGDDDDEGANATDRFLAQVEALSISTCVDACPACLASSCDLGHIDVMRHNVSRTLLKRAHEVLTADFTVTGVHLQSDDLLKKAVLNGGFVIHEHVGHLDSSVMRRLRAAGFQQHGRIFDPERLKIRTILYREEQA